MELSEAERRSALMSVGDLPFFEDETCDTCGKPGVIKFMGSSYCKACQKSYLYFDEQDKIIKKLNKEKRHGNRRI